MNDNPTTPQRPSLLQNWISLAGIILAVSSLFAVLCLLALDFIAHSPNPYMGILTYFVAPAFLCTGIALIVIGIAVERRRLVQRAAGSLTLFPIIDLNSPRHRKLLGTIAGLATGFFLLTAIGSYRSYHFTESRQFCGQTCHTVMKPEFTAYQNSPHARVACVECHIGPGATWFVKSKLSGSYQVYATAFNKYPTPIPTPIKNLRPAQETCEQCHWPQKFYGSAERLNQHFMANETNTTWTIRLLMKIGGGDPTHGPVGGIHWHMNIGNKIEYIAADESHQVIPWVRVTDKAGKVTVYQSSEKPLKEEQIKTAETRRMDCIDCHNRPSHVYNAPAKVINVAMNTGRINPTIPYIKKIAVEALTKEYPSTPAALDGIAASITKYYQTEQAAFAKAHPELIAQAITEVQSNYRLNFFPEMKVNWRAYPNNIGHTIFPGCYRCHDGKHAAPTGEVISHDCKSCHIILAQGNGEKLHQLSPDGLEFEHPVDIGDVWKDTNCAECHTGALAGQ